jgi:hypothetical protein
MLIGPGNEGAHARAHEPKNVADVTAVATRNGRPLDCPESGQVWALQRTKLSKKLHSP